MHTTTINTILAETRSVEEMGIWGLPKSIISIYNIIIYFVKLLQYFSKFYEKRSVQNGSVQPHI